MIVRFFSIKVTFQKPQKYPLQATESVPHLLSLLPSMRVAAATRQAITIFYQLYVFLGCIRVILGRLLRAGWRLDDNDRQRVTQLHHVVHDHLHSVHARHLELDSGEHRDVGRMMRRILQGELGLALADDRLLVRPDQSDVLVELAHAGDPAGEYAQLAGDDR